VGCDDLIDLVLSRQGSLALGAFLMAPTPVVAADQPRHEFILVQPYFRHLTIARRQRATNHQGGCAAATSYARAISEIWGTSGAALGGRRIAAKNWNRKGWVASTAAIDVDLV